jgi:hypothetical protein
MVYHNFSTFFPLKLIDPGGESLILGHMFGQDFAGDVDLRVLQDQHWNPARGLLYVCFPEGRSGAGGAFLAQIWLWMIRFYPKGIKRRLCMQTFYVPSTFMSHCMPSQRT